MSCFLDIAYVVTGWACSWILAIYLVHFLNLSIEHGDACSCITSIYMCGLDEISYSHCNDLPTKPAQAICSREVEDISSLEEKLGRPLSKQERSRIGISSLRLFLEELLQKRFAIHVYIRTSLQLTIFSAGI